MDFRLSEEHLMFQNAQQGFLKKEASKENIRECDKEQKFPEKFYKAVAVGIARVGAQEMPPCPIMFFGIEKQKELFSALAGKRRQNYFRRDRT